MLELPEILSLPPKLIPMIEKFNQYQYIVLVGGRGSGKTQSAARLLLTIADQCDVRITCGREIQNTIEESVHAVLSDLISEYSLAYDIKKNGITNLATGSKFTFKGFRDQGRVNIKGMENVDIVWIDEAQTVTKDTLDTLIPTIRKSNSKIIFTMNRFMLDDAVVEEFSTRPDCLFIEINYFENPHCTLKLKNEAEICKNKSLRDYNHIWLGQPLSSADDYLFNYEKLHATFNINPYGDLFYKQRVMGIDFAAQGNDQCVATVLDRLSNQHWQLTERSAWDEPDTTVSIGKIVHLIGLHKPDVTMLDIGGMGKPVYDRLLELGIKNLFAFDGASTQGVDTTVAANVRADAYLNLREWFDQGFLKIDKKDAEVVKQLEKIKFKYRSNGSKIIQPKVDMKKELRYSPDDADSLNMAVYGAVKYLGRAANSHAQPYNITRVHRSKRNG